MLKISTSLANAGVFREIELIGRWREGIPERVRVNSHIEIVRIKPMRLRIFGRHFERAIAVLTWYLRTTIYLLKRDIECINPHSLPVLPLAALVKTLKGCKLVYDTHELETETITCRGAKRTLFKLTEKVFIRSSDAICVVNKSIADWYAKTYNIPTPYVVKNVPHLQKHNIKRKNILRELFSIPEDATVFLYQGLLSEGRGLHLTLEAFKGKGSQHIVFMGYGELTSTIQKAAKDYSNIHYKSAVSPELIPEITPSADAGLSLIEDKCLSYFYSLPNKVYEYLNSGVPVIASAFPEMSKFVNENAAGWTITPSKEELSNLLDKLSKSALEQKRAAILNREPAFGWHHEEQQLLAMYKMLGLI
ncbi:glycosyltransferase [Bdellovibrio bacteriovorus]|uniref:glycosyltransferase n=1 Tax=Bdellovibrio bacteriovorus TaxID=959 RepID=UPI003CFF8AC9